MPVTKIITPIFNSTEQNLRQKNHRPIRNPRLILQRQPKKRITRNPKRDQRPQQKARGIRGDHPRTRIPTHPSPSITPRERIPYKRSAQSSGGGI